MAFPTVAWNSSGSDSAASGAGPATAVNGSLAATHANTTVNITDAVDLSGVDTTGLALLYVASSSGRQAARITAVSGTSGNWTVTVAEAYANTESGRTWAIGGKRQTLDGSTQFGLDARGGWTYDIQTDQTVTTNFRLTPNAVVGSPFIIKSTVGTRATKIQTATNSIVGLDLMGANNIEIQNLYFKTTAVTPGVGLGCTSFTAGASNVTVTDCVFDGWLVAVRLGDSGANVRMQNLALRNCEFKNQTQNCLWNQISGPPYLDNCYFHDNGSASSGSTVYPCLGQGSTSTAWFFGVTCVNCVFANNQGPAIHTATGDPSTSAAQTTALFFHNCSFYKNNALGGATAGIMGDINVSSTASSPLVRTNCVFYGTAAGNFAVKVTGSGMTMDIATNCQYGVYTANTSGTGLGDGTSPTNLSSDPFTSSTDFKPNGTAGGGAAIKQAGLSQSIFTATAIAPDSGAVQSGSSAASGSGPPGVMVIGSGGGGGWEY